MSIQDFIAIVRQASVLSEERRQELIENVEWTTPEERLQLVQSFTDAELKTKELDQGKSEKVEAFNEALEAFTKEELPTLVKEAEQSAKEGENPEELLKDWDQEK